MTICYQTIAEQNLLMFYQSLTVVTHHFNEGKKKNFSSVMFITDPLFHLLKVVHIYFLCWQNVYMYSIHLF